MAPAAGGGTELTFFNELEARNVFGKLIVRLAMRSARKGADDFAAAIKQRDRVQLASRRSRRPRRSPRSGRR